MSSKVSQNWLVVARNLHFTTLVYSTELLYATQQLVVRKLCCVLNKQTTKIILRQYFEKSQRANDGRRCIITVIMTHFLRY